MIDRWRWWARRVKREVYALALAARDPRVPWYARAVAIAVVAYAFSPLDLIPDPVPVLGYLDDLVLVPLGILLAVRLVPAPVLADCRARAEEMMTAGRPTSWAGAIAVIAIWLLLAALTIAWLMRLATI